MTEPAPAPAPRRDLASALLIGAGSLLMVLLMAHHPSGHGTTTAERVHGMVAGAGFNGLIHGGLILIIGALAIGYAGFAERLEARGLARAGLMAYLAGALALAVAGLINGFAAPGFAQELAGRPAEAIEAARPMLAGFWALNQAFAAAGVAATSAAVLLWSLALLRRNGLWRWVGAAGALAGTAGLVAMLGGWLKLDVHGFGLFVLVQALWGVAVAALLLWRRRG